jgi:histidine ammonia-lyase
MIALDGHSLTLKEIEEICLRYQAVSIAESANSLINDSSRYIDSLLEKDAIVYGVNTGFGKLASTSIPLHQLRELQENLIRSHAVSVGKPLSEDIVRAMMLIRLNTLVKGFSGAKLETLELLKELLNRQAYPWVPEKGSLGASGDLSPLAHLALILMGEGFVFDAGKKIPALDFLRRYELNAVQLMPKEGLALINGTSLSSGWFSVLLIRTRHILYSAISAMILSLEAYAGCKAAFSGLIHTVKPHSGQRMLAQVISDSLDDSKLINSSNRVQDPYSFRCIPQVIGPLLDLFEYAKNVNQIEINAATDNPLIFTEQQEVLSGGNFHAQAIAFPADFLAIALQVLGEISERRINHLLDPNLNHPLTPFLAKDPGLQSGLMIMQYTCASLVSLNKTLIYPASATSIPVSGNQEDIVSQAPNACWKLEHILDNLSHIIAMELISSAQALSQRGLDRAGKVAQQICQQVSQKVTISGEDRSLSDEIAILATEVSRGSFSISLPFDIF